MTLIKKRDVKDYFAARRLQSSRIHIVPASQPDATGFSGNEQVPVDTNPPVFAQDSTTDHTESGTLLTSPGSGGASTHLQTPPVLGRARE